MLLNCTENKQVCQILGEFISCSCILVINPYLLQWIFITFLRVLSHENPHQMILWIQKFWRRSNPSLTFEVGGTGTTS